MGIYFLLLSLFFCHFLADFTPLSTPWMLKAKRFGNPLFPIFCHAAIHATLMCIAISFYVGFDALQFRFDITDKLVLFQLFSHFLIDVSKGRITAKYPLLQDISKPIFWALFGFDQLLHATVIIAMVAILNQQ